MFAYSNIYIYLCKVFKRIQAGDGATERKKPFIMKKTLVYLFAFDYAGRTQVGTYGDACESGSDCIGAVRTYISRGKEVSRDAFVTAWVKNDDNGWANAVAAREKKSKQSK